MNLEELQRTMCAAVMQPLTAEEQMHAHSLDGEPMDQVASRFIKPNSRLTSFERLEIYNRQYWFRLQSAFAEDFPALRSTVGDERFEALTNAYLHAHQSRSFTLRNLGSKLFEWLSDNRKYAGQRAALALDVVKIEWACIEAFDNAEYAPLTIEQIASIGASSQLTLQPHLQLVALNYPADDLVLEMHQRIKREASEAGTKPESVSATSSVRLRLRKKAIWLALHRMDNSLYYKRVSRPEFGTLSAIRAGMTLSEALDAGFAGSRSGSRLSVASRISQVQGWFANWAELGWFCAQTQEPQMKEG